MEIEVEEKVDRYKYEKAKKIQKWTNRIGKFLFYTALTIGLMPLVYVIWTAGHGWILIAIATVVLAITVSVVYHEKVTRVVYRGETYGTKDE